MLLKISCEFLLLNFFLNFRRKCSIGQFAPLIGTKTDELKERLRRQENPLRWYSRKSITMQTVKEGPLYGDVYHKSAQKKSPTSEPACSIHSYHTICSSETAIKVCDSTETGKMPRASLPTNLVQLPPQKESRACTESLPEIYEHCEPISRPNLQGLPTNLNPLQALIRGSDFNEINNTSNPKRKLNTTVLLPAKCLKKIGTKSVVDKELVGLGVESNFPRELSTRFESDKPPSSPPENGEPSELMDKSIQSSPSIKLNRKVKQSMARNKKGNQKQNVELHLQQKDDPLAPVETKNVPNSPTHALLELFQTSDANSDFGGFSSVPEKKDSSLIKDTWEDANTDALWCFLSTSASSSPFIGF